MKIKRLFMPLGIVVVILVSLTVLLLPDFGVVFAQDSRTATREARQVTRTALAMEYANAQLTYDAGLARLGSIRITGTAYAKATATSRADGYARATANKIYVSTANAVSDARSTVHAATQRVIAPLTATAGKARVDRDNNRRATGYAVTLAVSSNRVTAEFRQFAATAGVNATARAVSYSTVEAKHATSQANAAVSDRQRNEQWEMEGRTATASARHNDRQNREADASQTQRYKNNATEQARILTRVARQTAEAGG